MILDKLQAIEKMNQFGKERIPFLFFCNFEATENRILPLDNIDENEINYWIRGKTNAPINPKEKKITPLEFSKSPISFTDYAKAFTIVKRNLDFGNTYLVNLTQATPIAINRNLRDVFFQANAPYKLWVKDQFVVFSPEIFVRIENGEIASFPMKGTIDAKLPNAEKELLNDPKEIAEHNTIVDLIRNDLSMIAKNVRVERFRYTDKLQTNQKELLQVSSEIVGELGPDFMEELGTHFFQLLPAGSISGAPKTKTIEIIKEAERYERGFYTGVFGLFDGQKMDSAVMIRFIEKKNGKLIFKSGGGITTFSQPEKEYQELIDKVYVPIY